VTVSHRPADSVSFHRRPVLPVRPLRSGDATEPLALPGPPGAALGAAIDPPVALVPVVEPCDIEPCDIEPWDIEFIELLEGLWQTYFPLPLPYPDCPLR
jgi:hypothetical protein